MAKKIVKLNRYRKSTTARTSVTSADVLAFPVQKQELAPIKEVILQEKKEEDARMKAAMKKALDGIFGEMKTERQREMEQVKAGIRKMLNGEPMGAQRKKRLNKLLTNGLYFMLYEQKTVASDLRHKANVIRKYSGDLKRLI